MCIPMTLSYAPQHALALRYVGVYVLMYASMYLSQPSNTPLFWG